jgi:hypothetical protein
MNIAGLAPSITDRTVDVRSGCASPAPEWTQTALPETSAHITLTLFPHQMVNPSFEHE